VGHEPSLVEGGALEHAIQFMHSLRSVAAVLCSHGDIISGIVGQLAAEGIEVPPPLAWKKASVWELDLTRGRVVAGRYVPPPS
jgi:broad specificity phosphatase PhoE